jgi:hypothetical protein
VSLNNWLSIYSLSTTRATRFAFNLFSLKIGYRTLRRSAISYGIVAVLLERGKERFCSGSRPETYCTRIYLFNE